MEGGGEEQQSEVQQSQPGAGTDRGHVRGQRQSRSCNYASGFGQGRAGVPRALPEAAIMVRSPAEEEGKDAGMVSGSWPRTRRYAVGDEVEVLLTGKGYRGARFEATITARLPGSGRYEVVYSGLVKCHGGPPLQEVVADSDLRPRPLPPQPSHEFELFDLVEAYHSDCNGWWPGVISDIQPKRRRNQETRFTISFPLFREVLEFSASFVRPRREFVYGSWIDAQQVLRGIPQYAEGSRIEVMSDKQGKVWRPATIKKMVGCTNYVVSYGNGESSIEVLHTRFIRPEPIYDKMKLESELEPSAKKYARKRNYSDSDYPPEFSTPDGNSDQYCSIPNKRVRKENVQTEEVHLRHSLNLRQYTDRSIKDVMDMEISSDKHVSRVKKLEREWEGLGVTVAKGEEHAMEKLICTPCDGKGRHSLAKALAEKTKDLSVSSLDDVIVTGSKYICGDVVVISDDSSHGSFIEISDDSSYNPIKNLRRMNLPDEELHSNHLIHNNQAPSSASRLSQSQAQNSQHYLLLDASRYSKEPLESSLDHSHKDGVQQIPLPSSQVQEFLGRNEAEELQLLDHLHLENMLMKIDNSAVGGENHEMCQKNTEVNSWVVGTSIEGADSGLTNRGISNQKTVNQSFSGAFPIGKLEPSLPRLHNYEGSLLCIEAPNDNKIDVENKETDISTEEAAAFLIRKLKPPSSGQNGVKADLECIEAPSDNQMEIKNERMGMPLVVAERFNLETFTKSAKDIAIVSYPECTASSQHHWGQPLESVSEKSAGPSSLLHPGVMVDISAFMPLAVRKSSNLSPSFSATSLLLMPNNRMEVFDKIPQIPHFRKAWNCPPELREGRAIGLVHSFATLAESIKNMRIQDEPTLYEKKMDILLDMEEEDGFEVGPLKVRLHNLLCARDHQIDLKNRKARLEKEILKIEAVNCGLEQRLKFLGMCIMGMEKKYQEMKVQLDIQKAENCSSISKLQVDLSQVEESIKYAEANFCSIATAPWQSGVGPSLP